MTIAVLAAPTTKTKRREPLGSIGMAASQAQSRPASSATAGEGRGRGERRTTRLSATQQGLAEQTTSKDGKRKAGACYKPGLKPADANFIISDYEEDAGGFKFSRVPNKPNKKPRPSIEPVPENRPDDVENAPPKSTPKRGRPPKKRTEGDASTGALPVKGVTTELPTRRPTRGTAKAPSNEPEPQPESATRNHAPAGDLPVEKKRKKGRPAKAKVDEPNGFMSPPEPPPGTKVALPMADTPVIQRNKELRGAKSDKGRRRSSLGMRGRRASSLIDSGASNGRIRPPRLR